MKRLHNNVNTALFYVLKKHSYLRVCNFCEFAERFPKFLEKQKSILKKCSFKKFNLVFKPKTKAAEYE